MRLRRSDKHVDNNGRKCLNFTFGVFGWISINRGGFAPNRPFIKDDFHIHHTGAVIADMEIMMREA